MVGPIFPFVTINQNGLQRTDFYKAERNDERFKREQRTVVGSLAQLASKQAQAFEKQILIEKTLNAKTCWESAQEIVAPIKHSIVQLLNGEDVSPYVQEFTDLSPTSLTAFAYGQMCLEAAQNNLELLMDPKSFANICLTNSHELWARSNQILQGLTRQEVFPTPGIEPSLKIHKKLESFTRILYGSDKLEAAFRGDVSTDPAHKQFSNFLQTLPAE